MDETARIPGRLLFTDGLQRSHDMHRHLPMILALLVPVVLPLSAIAQDSPTGRWRTIDDATGKPKSIVEIYATKDGRYAGKVVEILDLKDGPDPLCDQCKGANRDKPIKGMVILWGLQPDGDGKWSGGHVLDPENGKTYKSKLALRDGSTLEMSGCIAFLCRTQAWSRAR
jgi:uncharacterized protein (DUF2147 family)